MAGTDEPAPGVADTAAPEAAETTAAPETTTTTEAPTPAALTLGDAHTREPGILGAGWSITVDAIEEAAPSDVFDNPQGFDRCAVVTITATLDSLDNPDGDLFANPLSLPEVDVLTSDGAAAPSTELVCQPGSSIFEVEVTEGGTATYQTAGALLPGQSTVAVIVGGDTRYELDPSAVAPASADDETAAPADGPAPEEDPAGIEAAVNVVVDAINGRDLDAYRGYFAAACGDVDAEILAAFDQLDTVAPGALYELADVTPTVTGPGVGSASLTFTVAGQSTSQTVVYVFEAGAWKSTNCPGS